MTDIKDIYSRQPTSPLPKAAGSTACTCWYRLTLTPLMPSSFENDAFGYAPRVMPLSLFVALNSKSVRAVLHQSFHFFPPTKNTCCTQ